MFGKKYSEKVRKTYLYSHDYRDQKMEGGKHAKQLFQKHTNSASKKCWEKIDRKKCEKRFFIFTQISLKKMGWKKARNNFSRNTRIVR